MIVAIRENEIYKYSDWNEYFKKDILDNKGNIITKKRDIKSSPYNYTLVEVEDKYLANIEFADFDYYNDSYVFNREKYNERIATSERKLMENEYKRSVQTLIAERYSMQDEIAILRQKDIKKQEYLEYFDYCEKCKSKIKEKIYTKS